MDGPRILVVRVGVVASRRFEDLKRVGQSLHEFWLFLHVRHLVQGVKRSCFVPAPAYAIVKMGASMNFSAESRPTERFVLALEHLAASEAVHHVRNVLSLG